MQRNAKGNSQGNKNIGKKRISTRRVPMRFLPIIKQ